MANWKEILDEIQVSGSTHDVVRRKYLKQLQEITGRNVIVYYSGWLQKPRLPGTELNDADKNGFMNAIHGLDRDLGLDLVIHTPGGETAATESLVDYLRSSFGTNIRAIVPQLAMSAGTMIACACKQIVMGRQSRPSLDRFVHDLADRLQQLLSHVFTETAGADQPAWIAAHCFNPFVEFQQPAVLHENVIVRQTRLN